MHVTLWDERITRHVYGVQTVHPVGQTHGKIRLIRADGTAETVDATDWRVDA